MIIARRGMVMIQARVTDPFGTPLSFGAGWSLHGEAHPERELEISGIAFKEKQD